MPLMKRFRSEKNESIQMQSGSPVLDAVLEYEYSIRKTGVYHNPIIVIPGILGSNIIESRNEKPLWGDFGKSLANPKADANLRLISLPMEQGKTLDQLRSQSGNDHCNEIYDVVDGNCTGSSTRRRIIG